MQFYHRIFNEDPLNPYLPNDIRDVICSIAFRYVDRNKRLLLLISTGYILGRVPTAQGKQGKWPKKIPVRENTGNLEILQKYRETEGIWFSQVVNSLILKIKEILIFAAKISIFFLKSAKSVLCM